MGVTVRTATVAELSAVMNVLDGAVLETDYERVRDLATAGDVFVAVPADDPERVLGACVLDGDEIVAIAVRRRRRDRGIGSALVANAARDRERLVAEFDRDVAPFYASLGFDIRRINDRRYAGVLGT
ncbi:GNAT family N-acetyltransferase [Halorhabdus amylolytica]|uniref:GNAT family N-acetyltransferase n=1 Tax=Halorhabdus amylolytica TaxID=2559573 RepID=UPI0010AA2D45|nr:GNAT family N-acetyltransferase [Halorhabdus amylolytica]